MISKYIMSNVFTIQNIGFELGTIFAIGILYCVLVHCFGLKREQNLQTGSQFHRPHLTQKAPPMTML